jgi:serine/threonine protein kinase/Tol biopolymer transport system component
MIGTTLGHYRIVEKLGEGGMGVVYKAQDLHLDRPVALKVLPPEKVADPDRKRRFVQEAKAASALNHPHIVHIYDIDQSEGTDYIAMEYVAGSTLDARIGHHGMRLNDALKYAVQIADALTKAHAAGIVHRDLKPTNIMVSADGVVKVLDFGLAKLTEPDLGDEAVTATVHAEGKPLTERGVIVGTVAYMSPEQAEGKSVDARSDIFSLGSVLYQLVTGQQPFQGPSKLSVLSAILQQEPKPPSAIAPAIPHDLEKLISRCLRKDPAKRFQHMDDVKIALEDLKDDSESGKLANIPTAVRTRSRRWLWAAAAAAVVLLVATLLVWQFRVSPRDDLTADPLTTFAGEEWQPSFSPEGNKVAFVWNGDQEGNPAIYITQIGSAGEPTRLTTSAVAEAYPAWSPDDRWIAFTRVQPDRGNAAVMLIPPLGGPERRLTEAPSFTGLCWTPDGRWLVFSERDAENKSSIWAVHEEKGERHRLTTFVTAAGAAGSGAWGDTFPAVSPDGRILVFARGGNYVQNLYAMPLTEDLGPAGEPEKLTDYPHPQVTGVAWTANGREIVYAAGAANVQSLWRMSVFGWRVSVFGRRTPRRLSYTTRSAMYPAIAPKTSRLAYAWRILNVNLWRLDTRTGERTKLISSTYDSRIPQYSPDGRKIAFQSNRSGNLEVWTCEADGSDNCLKLTSFEGPQCGTPRWSWDGRWLALDSRVEGLSEIYVVAADGGKPQRVTTPVAGVSNFNPSWSRDGQWVYFCSDRTGRQEIWKMPVAEGQPVAGREAERVTHAGGFSALSSPDGTYLVYEKAEAPEGLFFMPTEGGEEQPVVSSSVRGWDVTNKGIYFQCQTRQGSQWQVDPTIQFFDMATRKITPVTVLPTTGGEGGICVSPDDRYVVYTQTDKNTTDLMRVERFR